MPAPMISPRSGRVTLLLALFLGWLGAHRFYVRKWVTAVLMLLTFGGLGIWTLVDLIFIVRNQFTDDEGKIVELTQDPTPRKKLFMTIGAVAAGLFIFIMTVITMALYMTSGIVTTVNNQLAAIRQGDLVKAYSYTSKDFQGNTSLDAFEQFVNYHPTLKENKSASFTDREVQNNNYGTLKGTLKSTDGGITPVEYSLVKENGTWKILNITISPAGATTTKPTETEDHVYKHQKYAITYPEKWEYTEPETGTVVFRLKGSNSSNYAYVSIQTVYSKKLGGQFASLKDIIGDLKKQLTNNFDKASILSTTDVTLPLNKKYSGQSIISTYDYEGKTVKQMDIILTDADGSFFYVMEYSAPKDQYDTYMPEAKAMLDSWDIK